MTNVSFNISIINDDVLENDEIFQLVFDLNSLPINVTRGEIKQATVTIVNDGGSGKWNLYNSALMLLTIREIFIFSLHMPVF